jgi:hypothetical protein
MLLAGNPPPISELVSTQRIAHLVETRNCLAQILPPIQVPAPT